MNVVDNNTPIGVYKGVKGFLKDNKDAQDSQVNWGKAIEASIKQRQKMHDTIMSKLKNVK